MWGVIIGVAGLARAGGPAPAAPAGMLPVEWQYGVCVSCHGSHGEGRPELGAPRIGGLDAAYVERQLNAFRAGHRGAHPDDVHGEPMVAIAGGLSDAQLPVLAAYVAALEPEVRPPGPAVSEGAAAYASCAACHGDDARGNAVLNAPALLHQDPAYLTRQLQHFRDGVRGGDGASAPGQQMAALAANLDDAAIEAIVGHIAHLRPALPELEQPAVTASKEAGLAAFRDIYAVATHPRCMNCHPDGDAPLQTDASIPHVMGVTRFSPLDGLHCSTCHAPQGVGTGLAPLPPANPIWSMPPRAMAFENRTPAALCAQLKDRTVNGGRGHIGLTEHIANDHLLQTSWHSGREAPPVTHPELVERFEAWGAAGGPCPE
jgi:cytochrome c553